MYTDTFTFKITKKMSTLLIFLRLSYDGIFTEYEILLHSHLNLSSGVDLGLGGAGLGG